MATRTRRDIRTRTLELYANARNSGDKPKQVLKLLPKATKLALEAARPNSGVSLELQIVANATLHLLREQAERLNHRSLPPALRAGLDAATGATLNALVFAEHHPESTIDRGLSSFLSPANQRAERKFQARLPENIREEPREG